MIRRQRRGDCEGMMTVDITIRRMAWMAFVCMLATGTFATTETCTVVERSDSPDGRYEVVRPVTPPQDTEACEFVREKKTGRIAGGLAVSYSNVSHFWCPNSRYLACGFPADRHTHSIALYCLTGSRFEEVMTPVPQYPETSETTTPAWLANEDEISDTSWVVSWEGPGALRIGQSVHPPNEKCKDAEFGAYNVKYLLRIHERRGQLPQVEMTDVQYDMDTPSCLAYRTADADLNKVYQEALRSRSGYSRDELVKTQRAWLKSRDARATHITTNTASKEYFDCVREATEARTKELHELLKRK